MDSMVYLISGSALLLGAAVAWLYGRGMALKASREIEKELEVNKEKLAMAEGRLENAENNIAAERDKVSELSQKLAIAGEREKSLAGKI